MPRFHLESKLQVRLADPDVVSNPSEYQKLAQSVAELDEVLHVLCLLISSFYLDDFFMWCKLPWFCFINDAFCTNELVGCAHLQKI